MCYTNQNLIWDSFFLLWVIPSIKLIVCNLVRFDLKCLGEAYGFGSMICSRACPAKLLSTSSVLRPAMSAALRMARRLS